MVIGFWRSWGLVVGMMIGSGIFTLPSVLAPYGIYSFVGWGLTLLGALCLVYCLSYLARLNPRAGGPSAYVRDAFGFWPAVIVAWSYWVSLVVAVAAIALSFAGYLAVYVPSVTAGQLPTTLIALSVIALFTWVSLRGTEQASIVQLVTTILKIAPLLLIGILGLSFGEVQWIEADNTSSESGPSLIAGIMLLIMWSYIGIEAATIPADETQDPTKTIPRALVLGTLTATLVYVVSLAGIMALIPQQELALSQHPFADAAHAVLGTPGAFIVGFGALVAIGGALNACVFLCGAMPTAGAREGLFPQWLGRSHRAGYSKRAILLSSMLAGMLVILNASKGLVGAFSFMIVVSTFAILIVYLWSALASVKCHWNDSSLTRTMHKLGLVISLAGVSFSIAALYGAIELY